MCWFNISLRHYLWFNTYNPCFNGYILNIHPQTLLTLKIVEPPFQRGFHTSSPSQHILFCGSEYLQYYNMHVHHTEHLNPSMSVTAGLSQSRLTKCREFF